MNKVISILLFAMLSTGCATKQSPWAQFLDNYPIPRGLTSRMATLMEIKQYALTLPVPLPSSTPYDNNHQRQDDYLRGFKDGWYYAVSGNDQRMTQAFVNKTPQWARGFEAGRKAYSEPLTRFYARLQKDMRNMHR